MSGRTIANIDDFDRGGVYYLFCEIDVPRIDVDTVPDIDENKWRKCNIQCDAEGNELSYDCKTIACYFYPHMRKDSIDGTKCVVLLNQWESNSGGGHQRKTGMDQAGAIQMVEQATLLGYGITDMMTLEEKETYITESAEYDTANEI